MKTIDPRIAHRRKQVAEEQARGSARRVLWLLVFVGVAGVTIWVARSPWFTVNEISVSGADHVAIEQILTEAGVSVGRPLLIVPARKAEAALLANPWVSDAAVSKVFPDLVEVAVIERLPVAVLASRGAQVVVSADGMVVAEQVVEPLPVVQVTEPLPVVGEVVTDPDALGGIQFFGALEAEHRTGSRIQKIEGELWARVGEFDVRLGRPVDMAKKARSLSAVLAVGQEPGSIINVIAPARPTVRTPGDNPQPEQEG